MSKRTKSHHPRPSMLRTRAAVVAAGIGASTLLGAGVSVAAESAKSGGVLPGVSANPVQAQAAAQAKAAQKAQQTGVKKAPAAKAPAWVQPVERYTLSATFGLGGNMWSHKHSGQDFAVSVGTPVAAVHGGTVVKAGPNGAGDGPAYGNAVVIKHSNGTYSQYAHLSKVDVRIGQNVTTGQRVALSGNTGNSSGPHLHFEIRTTPNYGTAVDPVAFLRSVGVKV
ncbi:peptidoglycan DD-metalloendopeptidase family protein [Streptomyces sp. BG9H]|uniref:Peptidoglycan DD-metalloendopeptidase family protein n=1 Tax=Streptomyces anatolicus TaxID=2675858 RepID=A0ABS6YM10_9ACTN|nr:M23 family metallopeptidase [Streptomyces anatolicus]MBW5422449.1 peptidoglycan DD-metalloendopeptidase family protein [Streptomyces anatolicus]